MKSISRWKTIARWLVAVWLAAATASSRCESFVAPTIGAVNANPELAAALSVAPGTALLRIERLTFTQDGTPLDYEHLYVRGEAFQYALRLPRHP